MSGSAAAAGATGAAAVPGSPVSEARETLVARWNARIARARELAASQPAAARLLEFRAVVAEFQRDVAAMQALSPVPPHDTLALRTVAALVPDFLSLLAREAPRPLADAARSTLQLDESDWRTALDACWASGGDRLDEMDPACAFVVEALLQPLAERAALLHAPPAEPGGGEPHTARCPACGGKPVVAVLRDAAQGARRALVCGLCFTEWTWPRIVCPACGERTFSALPVYSTPDFPAARLDACDTCRGYIRTVDLTKDAHAIPEVDELAGVSLDLWAREQGYRKLRRNLFRE